MLISNSIFYSIHHFRLGTNGYPRVRSFRQRMSRLVTDIPSTSLIWFLMGNWVNYGANHERWSGRPSNTHIGRTVLGLTKEFRRISIKEFLYLNFFEYVYVRLAKFFVWNSSLDSRNHHKIQSMKKSEWLVLFPAQQAVRNLQESITGLFLSKNRTFLFHISILKKLLKIFQI